MRIPGSLSFSLSLRERTRVEERERRERRELALRWVQPPRLSSLITRTTISGGTYRIDMYPTRHPLNRSLQAHPCYHNVYRTVADRVASRQAHIKPTLQVGDHRHHQTTREHARILAPPHP